MFCARTPAPSLVPGTVSYLSVESLYLTRAPTSVLFDACKKKLHESDLFFSFERCSDVQQHLKVRCCCRCSSHAPIGLLICFGFLYQHLISRFFLTGKTEVGARRCCILDRIQQMALDVPRREEQSGRLCPNSTIDQCSNDLS